MNAAEPRNDGQHDRVQRWVQGGLIRVAEDPPLVEVTLGDQVRRGVVKARVTPDSDRLRGDHKDVQETYGERTAGDQRKPPAKRLVTEAVDDGQLAQNRGL